MSSSPNPFENYFDSHEPRPELDSPFLNEEYLAEEARTAPTWRTPVPGFQLESPFLHAFEEGWRAIGELEVEESNEFLNEFDDELFLTDNKSEDSAPQKKEVIYVRGGYKSVPEEYPWRYAHPRNHNPNNVLNLFDYELMKHKRWDSWNGKLPPDQNPSNESSIQSVFDLYEYIKSLPSASLEELHFFTHGHSDGPVLANTYDSSGDENKRDPNDKDPRIKDFRISGVLGGKDGEKFKNAFSSSALVKLWGCDYVQDYRDKVIEYFKTKNRKLKEKIIKDYQQAIRKTTYQFALHKLIGIPVYAAPLGWGTNPGLPFKIYGKKAKQLVEDKKVLYKGKWPPNKGDRWWQVSQYFPIDGGSKFYKSVLGAKLDILNYVAYIEALVDSDVVQKVHAEETHELFDELDNDNEDFDEEEANAIVQFFDNEWEPEIEAFSEFQDELDEEDFDEFMYDLAEKGIDDFAESKYEFAFENPDSLFKTSDNHAVLQQHHVPPRRRRATPPCSAFLPANRSDNYEDYVTAQTTGRITLMINGWNLGGSSIKKEAEAFDSMQKTVESLAQGDFIYLATWQFNPTVPLTVRGSVGTWGDLFKRKAEQGVKIRIIMTDFHPRVIHWKSDLTTLDNIISQLPLSARDNLKYIVSMHPAKWLGNYVATHHQKFMVVKKRRETIAFCGGLDISRDRTPFYWTGDNYGWHDIHAKLEGLIAHDLEREFVLRWNREKDGSTAPKHPDWKPFENLIQTPPSTVDRKRRNNTQKLQMLRTVSVNGRGRLSIQDTRRDDILQGYLRLFGCATRFIFMENQYFREQKIADAIVRQGNTQPDLIVIIVVAFKSDDPQDNEFTKHGKALQNEFFTRLYDGFTSKPNQLRVYTMFQRLVHSKFILVDDRALCVGSANANPRGFFLDTELNVMLDHMETVRSFRHRLWSHNLGVSQTTIASWAVPDFTTQWDAVARANESLKHDPSKMTGEGVIPFDPRSVKGEKQQIPDVLTEVNNHLLG
jgi:phosphatidylserine/phosphatidylglycerophosphate/cardiolipin synthase-like enzyme